MATKIADRESKADYVLHSERLQHIRRTWKTVLLVTAIVCLSITLLVIKPRPRLASAELREQHQKVVTLKNMFDLCNQQVANIKHSVDQNDFFGESVANSEANRCISLSNRYNYELRKYHEQLYKLK